MSMPTALTRQSGPRSLSDFKDIHKGRRCFVVGNGPSLNEIDMSPLASEITFGCNRAYKGFHKWGFGFTYWSIEDQLVGEDIAEEWTREMISSPRCPCTVFVPEDLMHHVNKHVREFNNPCIPINFTRKWFDPGLPRFSTDPGEVVWGGTVTYLLIQLAALMGCDPIILVGIDFSYQVPSSVKRLTNVQLMSMEDDPNHFIKDYFGPGRKWHDPQLHRMKRAYMGAEKALRRLGIGIYNATPGTKLKVITRIDYQRALTGRYSPGSLLQEAEKIFANINTAKHIHQLKALKARLRSWLG